MVVITKCDKNYIEPEDITLCVRVKSKQQLLVIQPIVTPVTITALSNDFLDPT